MQALSKIKSRIVREAVVMNLKGKTPVEKALKWLMAYRVTPQGIIPSYSYQRRHMATQEETGYILGVLYMYGEKDLAIKMAKWEASVQKPDGAFAAMDDIPYTFDTAQVVRGFLAVLDELPAVESNLRRACDFIDTQIDKNGVIHTPSYDTWKIKGGGMLHEYGNLYVLPPMLQAGKKLNEPKYIKAAQRAMDNYRKKPDLVTFKPELSMLSHYFGYMMEALVDLGEVELAKKGLKEAENVQRADGAIPAYPGVNWVCSTGLAQLALAWYKLGIKTPADKALNYMASIQNASGGFFGGYGADAQYFPYQEISWAAKFFLEAHHWKNKLNQGSK